MKLTYFGVLFNTFETVMIDTNFYSFRYQPCYAFSFRVNFFL